MYKELHEVWKRELEKVELEKLPTDFYPKVANYLRRIHEEGRMIDKRTVKASLLRREMFNARRMLRELVQVRYRKVIKKMTSCDKGSSEFLTVEEEKLYAGCLPILEMYQNFVKGLLRGQISTVTVALRHKRNVLRFLKDIPEIIGADMQAYGSFKAEDLASLPVENANILVKHGLAEKVEIN